MSSRSWWERLIAPQPKLDLLCTACNTNYVPTQLICSHEKCGAVLPVQENDELSVKIVVGFYRLLMVLVGMTAGYLALVWPSYVFAMVTFYGFGYLLLRHYPEALRVSWLSLLLTLAIHWGLRIDLLTVTSLSLLNDYLGMLVSLFVLGCASAHIFSQVHTSALKAAETAFLFFIIVLVLDASGAFKIPGLDAAAINFWKGRVLFSSVSFGLAVLSIEAVVYPVHQPALTISNLIQHIPTLPLRILPLLELSDAAASPVVKFAVALVNSILRSLEHFYNRTLRTLLNSFICFPIQLLNYLWRKTIALLLHLARSVKRFSEQFVEALRNILEFLYHFSRVILLPIVVIIVIHQQSWRLGEIIFNYIHNGPVSLLWAGALATLMSLFCILIAAWALTHSAFTSLLASVTLGVLDFGNKFVLLFTIATWLFIGAAHFLAPAPYRIGPLTIMSSLYLLTLLGMALWAGKLTVKKVDT